MADGCWVCTSCSWVNKTFDKSCKACGKGAPAVALAAPPQAPLHSRPGTTTPSGHWLCKKCTWANKTSDSKCSACGGPPSFGTSSQGGAYIPVIPSARQPSMPVAVPTASHNYAPYVASSSAHQAVYTPAAPTKPVVSTQQGTYTYTPAIPIPVNPPAATYSAPPTYASAPTHSAPSASSSQQPHVYAPAVPIPVSYPSSTPSTPAQSSRPSSSYNSAACPQTSSAPAPTSHTTASGRPSKKPPSHAHHEAKDDFVSGFGK